MAASSASSSMGRHGIGTTFFQILVNRLVRLDLTSGHLFLNAVRSKVRVDHWWTANTLETGSSPLFLIQSNKQKRNKRTALFLPGISAVRNRGPREELEGLKVGHSGLTRPKSRDSGGVSSTDTSH
ncbi:hypothetical protein RRG08_061153 [Elysia crispata]|uniref:Uncharacterized protein n=1 Tax=Elysia crispata TaxID=231223 RepID=A0AAE0XDJ9_9GAST|nr:hypothetical protein RRG08_061153 [Elysia crispata]